VKNWVIRVDGAKSDMTVPAVAAIYPRQGSTNVYQDAVPKITFSQPVRKITEATFTMVDESGKRVPASVHQIGDGTWGVFPNQVFLEGGEKYTVRLNGPVCGFTGQCLTTSTAWSFTVSPMRGEGAGDTTIPLGFSTGRQRHR